MARLVDELEAKNSTKPSVDIALVGKYTVGNEDSYLSVLKALKHSSIHIRANVKVIWIEASTLEEDTR